MYVYMRKEGVCSLLIKSKNLVSGKWWSIFGRILLLLLIFFGFNGFILFINLLTMSFTDIPSDTTSTVNLTEQIIQFVLAGKIIQSVLSLFVIPFVVIFCGLIYEDLRNLKTSQEFPEPTAGTKAKYLLIGGGGCLVGIVLAIIVSFSVAKEFEKETEKWKLDEDFIMPTLPSQEEETPGWENWEEWSD